MKRIKIFKKKYFHHRFTIFEKYNKELLKKYSKYMEQEHYITKGQIVDTRYKKHTTILKLLGIPFEPISIEPYVLYDYGHLTLVNCMFYYLSPAYVCICVQVKPTPKSVTIYTKENNYL